MGPSARARRRARARARETLGWRWHPCRAVRRGGRARRVWPRAGGAPGEDHGARRGKSSRAEAGHVLVRHRREEENDRGPVLRWSARARAPAGLWAPSRRSGGRPGTHSRRPGQRVPATARGRCRRSTLRPARFASSRRRTETSRLSRWWAPGSGRRCAYWPVGVRRSNTSAQTLRLDGALGFRRAPRRASMTWAPISRARARTARRASAGRGPTTVGRPGRRTPPSLGRSRRASFPDRPRGRSRC